MIHRAVFLDTVGIIATINRSDQWHTTASSAWDRLRREGLRPVTTSLVLAECGNAFARLPHRGLLCDFVARLESRSCIEFPTPDDWHLAWAAFREGAPGDAGLVDHVSFLVMRRLSIAKAFTNDRHFRAAGFEVLF